MSSASDVQISNFYPQKSLGTDPEGEDLEDFKECQIIQDNQLLEEECKDDYSMLTGAKNNKQGHNSDDIIEEEPRVRTVLPWQKDPNMKMSIWSIIKDSIGKDISRITVPVFFNDPTNILQKQAQSLEYSQLLAQAASYKIDRARRIALLAVFQVSMLTSCARGFNKPFNPLLGETYELETNDYQFLAEQVSHHPPVSAWYCNSERHGYKIWSNFSTKTSFSGKNLTFNQIHPTFVEFSNIKSSADQQTETYQINGPTLSAHNLIIGTPYLDIGGKTTIYQVGNNISETQPQFFAEVNYIKRGWFSKERFRIQGQVYTMDSSKQKQIIYKIEGSWAAQIFLVDPITEERELVWEKELYPENSDFNYNMTLFTLQLNYFPSWLREKVAPTDTRLRPDQRALENGEMKFAGDEKNRLEEKQRAVRRQNQAQKIDHVPSYFGQQVSEIDGKTYWVYNNQYFEKDRVNRNWSHLPDLF